MRFQLAYVGIQVRDLDRSIEFYRDLLGMRVLRRSRVPETGGEWAELASPGSRSVLELNWYPEGSKFFAGPFQRGDALDHIAFQVDDVERTYRDFVSRGVPSGHPPFLEGGTLLAFVQDPDGNWIELTGPPVPAKRRPTRPKARRPKGRG